MSVSVLVCCHNSAARLRPTIAHLVAQRECDGIDWEIIVVDNASTDGTYELAMELLAGATVPFQILSEPVPGKTKAFMTGVANCRHEFISIVDDDNWVSPLWIKTVSDFMNLNPTVGLVGSLNEPVFESEPPDWFWKIPGWFACGHHSVGAGDVTDSIGFVPGAGSTFRKCAYLRVKEAGFSFFTTTLRGSQRCTGEDVELGLALRASGWRVVYLPELALRHFMPASRMTWESARRHARSLGTADLGLDPYLLTSRPGNVTHFVERMRLTWQWQAAGKIRALISHGTGLLKYLRRNNGGDIEIMNIEKKLGALSHILARRGDYTRHLRAMAAARWRTHW